MFACFHVIYDSPIITHNPPGYFALSNCGSTFPSSHILPRAIESYCLLLDCTLAITQCMCLVNSLSTPVTRKRCAKLAHKYQLLYCVTRAQLILSFASPIPCIFVPNLCEMYMYNHHFIPVILLYVPYSLWYRMH